jgi:hypothetical protein
VFAIYKNSVLIGVVVVILSMSITSASHQHGHDIMHPYGYKLNVHRSVLPNGHVNIQHTRPGGGVFHVDTSIRHGEKTPAYYNEHENHKPMFITNKHHIIQYHGDSNEHAIEVAHHHDEDGNHTHSHYIHPVSGHDMMIHSDGSHKIIHDDDDTHSRSTISQSPSMHSWQDHSSGGSTHSSISGAGSHVASSIIIQPHPQSSSIPSPSMHSHQDHIGGGSTHSSILGASSSIQPHITENPSIGSDKTKKPHWLSNYRWSRKPKPTDVPNLTSEKLAAHTDNHPQRDDATQNYLNDLAQHNRLFAASPIAKDIGWGFTKNTKTYLTAEQKRQQKKDGGAQTEYYEHRYIEGAGALLGSAANTLGRGAAGLVNAFEEPVVNIEHAAGQIGAGAMHAAVDVAHAGISGTGEIMQDVKDVQNNVGPNSMSMSGRR